MREKIKKIFRIFVPVALTAIVLYSGYQALTAMLSEKRAKEAYEELALTVGAYQKEQPQEMQEEVSLPKLYPALEIDTEKLKEMNADFRGWLYIPALSVSYPVVQGEDNDYYLKRSFEGEKLNAGSIFMDSGASADWSDRNTFVFGHNMRDGSMFGTFKLLLKDAGICAENPYFYIYTEDTVYTYEIFSIYKTKSDSERYMTFSSDETYDAYVEWALENSVYESQAALTGRPNIVSLSTCYGSVGSSRRVLIHGALVRTEAF